MKHQILLVQSLLTGEYEAARIDIAILGIMWLLVAIAIVIDLISGVRKAKERGEASTSFGYKQTVNKLVLYYACMLFALMFDCIGMFFYPLPVITFIAAAFLIFIEGKSVLEKANDKDKRKFAKSIEELSVFFENKDDLVKTLTEMVKKKIEENDTDKRI